MRQLTAGLVWHVTRKYNPTAVWTEAEVECPDLDRINGRITGRDALVRAIASQERRTELNRGDWHCGWRPQGSPYPSDIYRFEISIAADSTSAGMSTLRFRHRFYNGATTWFVSVAVSKELSAKLIQAAPVLAAPIGATGAVI